jgi:hypothetical protein
MLSSYLKMKKQPIAAKAYMNGTSWCSTQVKVKRAQKKTGGILNVFGVYHYYTSDKTYTHCCKKRNSKQFIDFIERIDSLYDSTIKGISL